MSNFTPSLIKCQLCGTSFQKITNTHLQKAHPGWTLDKYRERFGENSLMSDDWRWILSQSAQASSSARNISANITKREKQKEIAEEFTLEEFQVVVGGLLGDSYLFQPQSIKYPPTGTGSTYLEMQHCFNQVPYAAWKGRFLNRFSPRLLQWMGYNTVKSRFDVKHKIAVCSHFLFGDMAKEFYPSPTFKKVLPLSLVEQLEPLGLAIWYQDDGTYPHDRLAYFCTDSFAPEDVAAAAEILTSKFDIPFKVHNYKGDIARLAISGDATSSFCDLIREFVHPSMSYKIDHSNCVFAEVTKRMKFIYGHYLLDYDGACSTNHGHNAVVEFSVRGPINPDTGMVIDFGDIKKVVKPLLDAFDHAFLNDENPIFAVKSTAEVIASYLAATLSQYIPGLRRIRFYETDTSCVDLDVQDNIDNLNSLLQRLAESGEWWQSLQKSIKSSVFPLEDSE